MHTSGCYVKRRTTALCDQAPDKAASAVPSVQRHRCTDSRSLCRVREDAQNEAEPSQGWQYHHRHFALMLPLGNIQLG